MTIPTLLAKYQEQVTVTKLKKAYSVLSNAFKMAEANGEDLSSNTFNDFFKSPNNVDMMKSYIKGEIKRDTNHPSGFDVLIAEDGIVYGFHANYQISATVQNYDKTRDPFGQKRDATFWFTYTDKGLFPGASSSDLPDDVNINISPDLVCPQGNIPWITSLSENNCTYWTLKTGKLKKKAGETLENYR